jgi:hypothetical protein
MPTAAVVAGASLGSAVIGANAAQSAAKKQAAAAAQARQDMLPFSIPGQGAMGSLAQLYGINPQTGAYDPNQAFDQASLQAFQRSPDYQFAMQQGLGALENSQAAKGMLRSGNTLRGITEFGQGLATQTFGNYRGALAQLAGIGAGAASGAGQAAMQQGAAQASGIVGAGNAWAGALGSMGNYAMMQNQMNQQNTMLSQLLRPSGYGQPMQYGAPAPYSAGNPYGNSGALPGGVGNAPY